MYVHCIVATQGKYTVKSLVIFPSPAAIKLSLAGKNLIIPGQGDFAQ
jgi:hypothetical protein